MSALPPRADTKLARDNFRNCLEPISVDRLLVPSSRSSQLDDLGRLAALPRRFDDGPDPLCRLAQGVVGKVRGRPLAHAKRDYRVGRERCVRPVGLCCSRRQQQDDRLFACPQLFYRRVREVAKVRARWAGVRVSCHYGNVSLVNRAPYLRAYVLSERIALAMSFASGSVSSSRSFW